MSHPPFDPPYLTRHETDGQAILSVTQGDGSVTPASAKAWVDIGTVVVSAKAPANPGGRHYLRVPFAEKDEAKALGARWDAAQKKWYVPAGVDLAQFDRWTTG